MLPKITIFASVATSLCFVAFGRFLNVQWLCLVFNIMPTSLQKKPVEKQIAGLVSKMWKKSLQKNRNPLKHHWMAPTQICSPIVYSNVQLFVLNCLRFHWKTDFLLWWFVALNFFLLSFLFMFHFMCMLLSCALKISLFQLSFDVCFIHSDTICINRLRGFFALFSFLPLTMIFYWSCGMGANIDHGDHTSLCIL